MVNYKQQCLKTGDIIYQVRIRQEQTPRKAKKEKGTKRDQARSVTVRLILSV